MIILIIFSIVLMVWDSHSHTWVKNTRHGLAVISTPFVYVVNAPFAFFDFISDHLQSQQSLLEENTELKARELILQGQLQKLQALQTENVKLRELLRSTPATHHVDLKLAHILAANSGAFHQEILLNKGSHDGVFVNQAVLDANGIMGQVVEVDPTTSKVLLLTDPRSGIPVEDNRNGLQGILIGRGSAGNLEWLDAPPTADIKVGDLLTSSGLGGHYPVGYPVGVVSYMKNHTQDQFLQVIVTPSAQINSSEHVLLVWPDKTQTVDEKK